jgi:diadenosine tetraphosphate (Ap4A) HIT family hydrolase
MNEKDCYICDWISRINVDEKKYFIAELETGYIFLSSKWQYFRGYTFFISKIHVSELHLMPIEFRKQFLFEMTVVSEAVQNVFKAVKINCESLGNSCSHVHWHIIPRYENDPLPEKAIWNIDRSIIESVTMSDDELSVMQRMLTAEIKELATKYKIKSIFM